MSIDLIKRLGIFVVLVLVQGLVFNHIHLFNCATPLLYILMVLHFRRNHPRWSVMLWSFMMGLCIDVFANTPGVAAASMTFIGLLQPYLFELFVPRDSADDLEPSMRTIGVGSYVLYTLVSYSFIIWYSLLWRPSISSIGWSGSSASVAVQPSRCCSSWHWRASARDRTLLQDREQ